MNNIELYSEKLTDSIYFSIGFIIFVALIMIALIVVCMKVKYGKLALLPLIGGLVISSAIYFIGIFPYQRDIQEAAYITYSGDFYVEECYSVSGGSTYILIQHGDGNEAIRYKVRCDVDAVENDTAYTGVLVYSKHSKCLMDIELQAK